MTVNKLWLALDSNVLQPMTVKPIQQAAYQQTLELLDDLGYLDLDKNNSAAVDDNTLIAALVAARSDLRHCELAEPPAQSHDLQLSSTEVAFFKKITSLDGHFKLANFSLEQIKSDALFTRVLNYRLAILALTTVHFGDNFSEDTLAGLNQLGQWAAEPDHNKVLALSDNFEVLISTLMTLKGVTEERFCGIVYFENSVDTLPEAMFKNSPTTFVKAMAPLTGADLNNQKWLIQNNRSDKHNQRLQLRRLYRQFCNQFFLRLLQIQLLLAGTYDAKLDTNMGRLGFKAIEDFVAMENHGESKPKIDCREFVYKLGSDFWAVNVVRLNQLLANDIADPSTGTSISGAVEQLTQSLKPQDRPVFLNKLDTLINANDTCIARRTKTSKNIFARIGYFFKKIGDAILSGIQFVINAVKKLFEWVKNGIRLLLEEIGQAITQLKAAAKFVFGQREINSANIHSTFDFDFDAVTYISGAIEANVVAEHRQKLLATGEALSQSAALLTQLLPMVITVLRGPAGWLAAGLKLLKNQALSSLY